MGIFHQGLALQERGWLGTMAVDTYIDLARMPCTWLPDGRLKQVLAKRHYPPLDPRRIRTRPLPSAVVRAGCRVATSKTIRNRWVFWHNDQFDRWVASHLPGFGDLAFGYESASLHSFRRAKDLGLPCVLYQPIACPETAVPILAEEAERFPGLADSLRYDWFPEEEMARRREERELADAILCASTFTARSLVATGVPPAKIRVEPYGVDQTLFVPHPDKYPRFSVIWASSFTHTKGIGYLLDALARAPVPGLELVLAGYPFGDDPVAPYEDRVRVRRLGHVTRTELGAVMGRCHAHVFPTLLDGFGRNIIEAMAAGLPVITTPHGAGPDLIEDGVTGFIVPIRDPDALAAKLAWIYDHPAEASEMGERGRARIAMLTEGDYRRRFADRIGDVWQTTVRE